MGDMQDPIADICKVLEIVIDRLEAIEKELSETSRLVTEEIIGGIKSVYDKNARVMGVSDLKAKYADFPYAGDFNDVYGSDLFEKLYDMVEELKHEEGYTEDSATAKIKEILDAVKAKFDKLKAPAVSVEVAAETPSETTEASAETPSEEKPAEEVPAETPAEEPDEIDALIKDLKKGGGLVPGARRE